LLVPVAFAMDLGVPGMFFFCPTKGALSTRPGGLLLCCVRARLGKQNSARLSIDFWTPGVTHQTIIRFLIHVPAPSGSLPNANGLNFPDSVSL
jgi:hypothetical protein